MDLRILFVEDSADDVELLLRRLHDAEYQVSHRQVRAEGELRAALYEEAWDVALVDYNLPGFGGPGALKVLAEMAPDVPTITVSGAIDEDTAVSTITAGAVDYVLKDNLIRLAPAVQRAIAGADLRRRHRLASERAFLASFALDHSSQLVAMVDAGGAITYVNDVGCALLGVARADLLGLPVWDLDDRLSVDRWPDVWRRAEEGGIPDFEIDRANAAGERLVLDMSSTHLPEADLLLFWGRDIRERKEAEERARASEEMYRRIVETASEGIWVMDAGLRTTFVNLQMAEMLHSKPEDMVGRPTEDFVFEEDLEAMRGELSRRASGKHGKYEGRLRCADGEEVWVGVSAVALMDPDAGFQGSVGMFTDVTESRLAEAALGESEARFMRFAQRIPGYVFMRDEHHRYVFVNDFEIEDQGVPRENWIGSALEDLWTPEEAAGLRQVDERVLKGEVVEAFEEEPSRRGTRYMRSLYFPIPRDGKPPLIAGLSLDISDEHEAQEALRESEARFQLFAENMPGSVIIEDEAGCITFVNEVGARWLGAPQAEIVGKTTAEIGAAASAHLVPEVEARVRGGETVNEFLEEMVMPSTRAYRVIGAPLRGAGGTGVGFLTLDVSDRVHAEEEVRRTAEQLRRTVEGAVLAMGHVVETRDPYTAGHERRVAELAVAIAGELGLAGEDVEALRLAGLIHDIGKIAVPAEILAKPGRLTEVEFDLIKQHTRDPASRSSRRSTSTARWPRSSCSTTSASTAPATRAGSPARQILLEARILAVADVVEAMSSHRPYRRRPRHGGGARRGPCRGAGSRYDDAVVAACLQLVEEQGFSFSL